MTEKLVERLRIRAAVRRQITTRKSVQEGKPDKIAELLDEAAHRIVELQQYEPYEIKCLRYRTDGPTPCLCCENGCIGDIDNG